MKIYRPLWSEGAFLAPQQFQQQTRWDAYVADVVAHMSLSSPWGVISAEFDESALTVSRLNPVNLVVRFPDGTLVDTGISDNLPPACDLSHLTGYSSVDIVLALPLLSANGGNLSSGNGVSRPCRWQQEWLPVQDLAGQERTDMAVLRHAITLRYAHDDNSAYLTCPVQARYFNTTNAGEELWERIRTVLREPVPDTAVLTCFYRAITLGFVGRYRKQGDERREDVLEALTTQAMPFKLKHDAPVIMRASGFSGGKRRWWLAWLVGALALGALWLTFSHVLQGQIAQLIGQG